MNTFQSSMIGPKQFFFGEPDYRGADENNNLYCCIPVKVNSKSRNSKFGKEAFQTKDLYFWIIKSAFCTQSQFEEFVEQEGEKWVSNLLSNGVLESCILFYKSENEYGEKVLVGDGSNVEGQIPKIGERIDFEGENKIGFSLS